MIRFFVFEFNSKLDKTRIFDSFKSADEAYKLADKLNNVNRLHLSYYVSLCSVENVQREIDLKLIDACKMVADSLYLADRCLLSRNKRKRYGCSDFWFNHAYQQCEQFSKYLE